MAEKPLEGRRILVTRPAAQADSLCEQIASLGGIPQRLPLLAIEACEGDAVERLLAAGNADWWIFTSANAVRHSGLGSGAHWPERIAAIGAATARALEAEGHPPSLVPSHRFSSEALLDLPPMHQVGGQRIVIVTGENGLTTLADTLRERGADVETIAVYRRVPVAHPPALLRTEIEPSDLVVLTSGDALQQLLDAVGDGPLRQSLLSKPVVVPSRRVLEQAQAAGFEDRIIVPDSMSDAAILQALLQWAPPTDHSPAMPESTASAPAPAPAPSPRHGGVLRFFVGLAWLVLLALIAAAAYGTWSAWQFRAQMLEALDAQQTLLSRATRDSSGVGAELQDTRRRLGDLAQSQRQQTQSLSEFERRLEQTGQKLTQLSESLQGGRFGMQLAEVEQVLFLASERLQLAGDVASAQRALGLADRRLAALSDPRVFKLRQAIANDQRALSSVPKVDRAAAALALSSLISQAPWLPLVGEVPDRYEATDVAPDVDETRWWRRAWQRIAESVLGIVRIQRKSAPIEPLLAPEQQGLVQTILLLKLEGTRAALLSGDTRQFRVGLRSTIDWLRTQYRQTDPAVASAIAELQAQQDLELSPPLPDLSASLEALAALRTPPSP